jgi:hypothetical protein
MTPEPDNSRPASSPEPKKASLLQTVWIVVSGLFMIGRKRDFDPSAPKIDPALLVIVAIIGAVVLIASLITLATFIAH